MYYWQVSILDNVSFDNFCESLCRGYKLPSRGYMTNTIIPTLFDETVDIIKEILKQVKYISITTDAWSSLSKQSYITVTAHLIDDDVKLHKFVLDTSEIKVRHTSENLLAHVKKVMKTFNLNDKINEVTVNGNDAEENEENDDGIRIMMKVIS